MRRVGQVIGLKPDQIEAYERLHAAVWPEVLAMISPCNIRNYSIFRHGNLLFAYCQLPPAEARGLVSQLHRSSAYLCRRAALASWLDTSGLTDKQPVLTQSCRMSNVRIVIFLAPTRSAWRI